VKGIAATAEYRFITERTRLGKDGTRTESVVCTEPSPDIAVAYSNALAASAKYANVDVTLQYQNAAAIAQLGKRYATVQLLRDMLYRDCELYAAGAISPTEYAFRLSRFGGTVVTLLGIELVSGDNAAPPAPTKSPDLTPKPSPPPPGNSQATAAVIPSGVANAMSLAGTAVVAADEKSKAAQEAVVRVDSDIKAAAPKAPTPPPAAAPGADAPPPPSSTDTKAAAALDVAINTGIVPAWKAMDSAWARVVSAGGKADSQATDLVAKANEATTSLAKPVQAAHVMATADGTSQNVKAADTAIGDASQKLTDAVKALKAVDPAIKAAADAAKSPPSTAEGGSQGSPPPAPRSISDQQARTIQAMQQEYLAQQKIVPMLVVCADALASASIPATSLANAKPPVPTPTGLKQAAPGDGAPPPPPPAPTPAVTPPGSSLLANFCNQHMLELINMARDPNSPLDASAPWKEPMPESK